MENHPEEPMGNSAERLQRKERYPMRVLGSFGRLGLLGLGAGLLLSACVDEKEIFLPFPLYDEPASEAKGVPRVQ